MSVFFSFHGAAAVLVRSELNVFCSLQAGLLQQGAAFFFTAKTGACCCWCGPGFYLSAVYCVVVDFSIRAMRTRLPIEYTFSTDGKVVR